MKIEYDLIRYRCENGTLEIRRYDEKNYWDITGHYISKFDNDYSGTLAQSPNHPNSIASGCLFENIINLAKSVDNQKFLEVAIEIVKAISKLDVKHENSQKS